MRNSGSCMLLCAYVYMSVLKYGRYALVMGPMVHPNSPSYTLGVLILLRCSKSEYSGVLIQQATGNHKWGLFILNPAHQFIKHCTFRCSHSYKELMLTSTLGLSLHFMNKVNSFLV